MDLKDKKNSKDNSGLKPEKENSDVGAGNRKKGMAIKYRKFPGPEGINSDLRIAFDKKAFADFIGHSKTYLDVEICGVLIGNVFEDEDGIYININAIIEGNSSKQGATHVTFTQETWNIIHNRLDKEFAGKRIVG